MPETASRWVSPVVRKSFCRSGSRPASSPSTRAGTRARRSGGSPETDRRRALRIWAETRHHGSGPAVTSGASCVDRVAATSPSVLAERWPSTRTDEPSGTRSQVVGAKTTTGCRSRTTAPAVATRVTASRTSASSPNRPVSRRGSSVTVPSSVTSDRASASRVSGLSATRSARTPAAVATAANTSTAATAVRPTRRPRHHHSSAAVAAHPPTAATVTTGAQAVAASAPSQPTPASRTIRRSGGARTVTASRRG